MHQFCEMKGILRQYSVARTPQQNGVAERRNRTLIEVARTMLADSKLQTTFWVEAINTACYVQNRVLVADEGFFVEYSLNSKAFKVFNSRTSIVEENLHIRFSKNTPNVVGSGPYWLFDIDALTRIMNYEPIVAGTQCKGFVGTKASDNACQAKKETEPIKDYILLPLWTTDPPFSHDPKSSQDDGFKPSSDDGKKVDEDPSKGSKCKDQEKQDNVNNTNNINTVSLIVNVAGTNELPFDLDMPALEDISTFNFLNEDEDDSEMADINNLETTIHVSPTPTTRNHKDHPLDQGIRDLHLATQTRNMSKNLEEHGFMSSMGELTFFLGLQVKQKNDGIFISQDKYVAEIIKKFGFTKVKNACTPMETQKPLLKDEDREEVDVHMYRVDEKEIIITKSSVRRDLQLEDEDGVNCLPNSTIFGNLELMGEPKRKNTQVPQPSDSTKHVADDAVYKELDDSLNVSKLSNDSLLTRGNTLQSDEDSMKLNELMELCTSLQSRVLNLEKTKTTQALEITSLKRRVNKLDKKQSLRTYKLKRLYKVGLIARVNSSEDEPNLGKGASKQGRIKAMDADEDITLVNDQDDVQDDAEMFNVNDLHGEEVFVEKKMLIKSIATTDSAAATITIDEVTLAKALAELKASKPKVKGVVIQEPSETTTTITTNIISLKSQDKDKGIMVEEPMKPKKKDQIRLDEEAALKLQAELQTEFKAEQRLAREKYKKELEANIALIETWDDVQAKINVDYQLAERLQVKEQQELTDEENATLFMTELVEDSSKRAGAKLTQERSKKQKLDDDKEIAELKKLIQIIPNEEELAIDAIPLAVKSLKIVD
nr:hypothetical protein [Tanacetum cinerariifolium]